MHQVARPHVKRFSNEQTAIRKVRVVLLLANMLDCETLSAVVGQHEHMEVLAATADIEFGLARCDRLQPHVLILDPKVGPDMLERVAEMVRLREVEHLLVLDDRLYEGRLTWLLQLPAVSYITRQAGSAALLAGILNIFRSGERSFDPTVRQRILRSPSGLRLERPKIPGSIALLTARELQVMKLLATGYSVRSCAEYLDLAESTIDNHKSRLMKKLDVHKIVELTHKAIREGLIVV